MTKINQLIVSGQILNYAATDFEAKQPEVTENNDKKQESSLPPLSDEKANEGAKEVASQNQSEVNSVVSQNHQLNVINQNQLSPHNIPYVEYQPDFNDENLKLQIKKMRIVCFGTIACFLAWLIAILLFIIFKYLFVTAAISVAFDALYNAEAVAAAEAENAKNILISWIFLGLFFAFYLTGFVACGIIGSKRCGELAKKDRVFANFKTQYFYGIFIPYFQIFTAVRILSRIKRIYRPFFKKAKS